MLEVIIIDDEPWIIKGLLTQIDWSSLDLEVVSTATDGTIGYNNILYHKPDIVLTDIRMPSLNGLELIDKCRAQHISCKFILLSGYSEFEYAQTAIRLNVIDYLLKPIISDALTSALNKAKSFLIKESAYKNLINTNQDNSGLAPTKTPKELVRKIKVYIDEHFQENLNLEVIAKIFFVNKSYLSQIFKKHMGIPFSYYLTNVRMSHAAHLLLHTDLKALDIGYRVGYKDYSHFKKVFKKTYDVSPSIYRNQQ